MSADPTTTLCIDVRPGDALAIGSVVVEVAAKTGNRARLLVHAPRDVLVEKLSLGAISAPEQTSKTPTNLEGH